ncbi:M50 family metallopeptidase [filamentous cyanobacterium LEGE 11480]|uniref:M50 family metallopeptidase n=1 Tax=Romeriopsis navalis LEGE 11480 TaxID=2777977 RepID=A0A928VMP0_9CYAN|nr:hypothetical protein [Romeriopsis navalis]MBE9029212.1 M50 family metallopeptidase [Romeriopsis navalis LEGE 11480]
MPNFQFDTIAIFALLISIQTLVQVSRNWADFWDDRVTANDRSLAQRLGLFVILPLTVLLHEVGHALATWQVGGTVVDFQWRFYWGFIIPVGDFSLAEDWWISFSGNLVSIVLALLPIPFLLRIRKRIIGEILYSFVLIGIIQSLVAYPILSFVSQRGDWLRIYDFTIQPYATITLIVHIALLGGLWQLYRSPMAIRWRLGRNPAMLDTWESLMHQTMDQPMEIEPQLALADLLIAQNEPSAAKQVAAKLTRTAPQDERVQLLQIEIACQNQDERRTITAAKKFLRRDLTPALQIRLYQILSFSQYKISRFSEAVESANQGLTIAPNDNQLLCYRAINHWALGQTEAAQTDLDLALTNTPDPAQRQSLQTWCQDRFNRK